MKRFEIKDHEPSYLPDGEWKLAFSDEFDGTELDETKWSYRLNFWGKRFPAYSDRGVVLDGKSHVELHRVECDGCYVSPQLLTGSNSFDIPKGGTDNPWGQDEFWPLGVLEEPKFVHRYGYYECRCKFQKEPQVMWSAFWTQSPSIGARFEPEWCGVESDIMEHFETGKASTGNIMGGYGVQFREEGRVTYPMQETEDGWHYFGMNWQPDGYDFYCDGVLVSHADQHVSHVPQFILLTTEVQGYRVSKPHVIKASLWMTPLSWISFAYTIRCRTKRIDRIYTPSVSGGKQEEGNYLFLLLFLFDRRFFFSFTVCERCYGERLFGHLPRRKIEKTTIFCVDKARNIWYNIKR